MDLTDLLKQAEKIEKTLAEAHEKLKSITVETITPSGKIKFIWNAASDLQKVEILDPSIFNDPEAARKDIEVGIQKSKSDIENKGKQELQKVEKQFEV